MTQNPATHFKGPSVHRPMLRLIDATDVAPSAYDEESAMSSKQLLARWDSLITEASQRFHVPKAWIRAVMAHGDGNYFADAETLKRLEGENRVAFRYVDATGQASAEANPNGSLANIAGILSEKGNVLGMMPHPERLSDPLLGGTDGRAMFEALAKVAA